MRVRTRRFGRGKVVLLTSLLCVGFATAHAGPFPASDLPNLVPRKPYNVAVGEGLALQGPVLRFTSTVENRGAYALDVVANPADADGDWSFAGQCVAWSGPACLSRAPVPSFVFDPLHGHFHFAGFALYELRRLTATGLPDMTSEGLVGTSRKASFCLEDSEPNQPDPSATGLIQSGTYLTCSDQIQGISAGWADVYPSGLAGQELSLDGVPDGDYAIVISVDSDHVLHETTRLDNVSTRNVRLRHYGSYIEATTID